MKKIIKHIKTWNWFLFFVFEMVLLLGAVNNPTLDLFAASIVIGILTIVFVLPMTIASRDIN